MPYADPVRQATYQANLLKRRRLAWVTVNGPCRGCGGNEKLEVDHVNPLEKVSHTVWSWSAERRAGELLIDSWNDSWLSDKGV